MKVDSFCSIYTKSNIFAYSHKLCSFLYQRAPKLGKSRDDTKDWLDSSPSFMPFASLSNFDFLFILPLTGTGNLGVSQRVN